ncbi:MAG: hypothetical protein JWR69_3313 [Pedosphaera sp.]|nr:hypothetical protein [Pedosphaera sp.]
MARTVSQPIITAVMNANRTAHAGGPARAQLAATLPKTYANPEWLGTVEAAAYWGLRSATARFGERFLAAAPERKSCTTR